MKLDWGSVPAWLGAASLLLAFRIFLRDRKVIERAQVDTLAVWFEVERDVRHPGQPRIEEVQIKMSIRNGSDLPVELTYAAWGVTTRWTAPDISQPSYDPNLPVQMVHSIVPGTRVHKQFVGPLTIAPQDERTFEPWQVNIAHLAPVDANQLDPRHDAVRCILLWALVTDNAGRRWRTRHRAGKTAKRVRWWSWHDEFYPYEWKNPMLRGYWRAKNWTRDSISRLWQKGRKALQQRKGR